MKSSGSLAGRALLAVGLMIGFYGLAIGLAGVLLFLPYAELVYAHRLHLNIAIFSLVGAGTILWSIVPRWDRFEAPGPLLEPTRHPKLFAEIEGVARATGQAMPAEVFLVGDVNAWVAQRGGVMGLSSQRVMGLGLPLLQVLSVSELRAVLAHEFGHFYGGDTRLGPWVYKTRAAIGRTLAGLSDSILQKPFLWYGKLFLWTSQAVSRRQEFSADALASRVVGARPLVEGLKKVQTAAPAFDAYWSQEVRPVLQAGYLPPLADGFRRFAAQERIAQAMEGMLEKSLGEAKTDPYDTHPTLPERIAAVAGLPAGPDPAGEPRAVSLLSDLGEVERRWLAQVAGPEQVEKLRSVTWEDALATAFLPGWREAVASNRAALEGATVGALGEVLAEAPARLGRLSEPAGEEESAEAGAGHLRWLLAAAVPLALERAGWTLDAPPGAPVTARRDGAEVYPFEVVQGLASGQLAAEDWRARAARLGVDALRLDG